MFAIVKRHPANLLWIALNVALLIGVAGLAFAGSTISVTQYYSDAALSWIAGESMYDTSGMGFLYLPQSAIVYIPFAVLPNPWGDVLWRAISLGLFALGCYRLFRLSPQKSEFFNLSAGFVALLLCADCMRNGQATVIMTATMLLAIDAIRRERWHLCTFLLLIGFAIKPLSIVLILLVGALYAPLRWRLAVGGVLLLLAPFAFQSPDYVWQQYHEFGVCLFHTNRLGHETWWAQIFGMLKAFGLDVPNSIQMVSRLLCAVGTLGLCFVLKQKLDTERFLIWLYTLTAVYLMLLNPRTENCTYCIVGPALGVFYAEALCAKRWASAAWMMTLAIAILGSFEIGQHITPEGIRPIWMAPLACTLFAVYAAYRLTSELNRLNPAPRGPDLQAA
ncbi:glycosyltransferase family 87 protein [Bremerella sp. JC770]|uniref:glycosyltransferase family 87 protein n=1 Tax=Bremerella sp. JC770 TaxID=3232137 RepID=UPI003457A558